MAKYKGPLKSKKPEHTHSASRVKIIDGLDCTLQAIKFADKTGKMNKLSDAVKPDDLPSRLLVTVEATHSGVNKNWFNYLPDRMEASAHTWVKDYHKPVLTHHDDDSEPIGRVVDFMFKRSVMNAELHCIELTLEITDAGAISKFLDGRYNTFSVSAFLDAIICNICGANIIEDGYCGHWRGEIYEVWEEHGDTKSSKKVRCIWEAGNFDYYEISVVNVPADPLASTMEITIPNDSEGSALLSKGPKHNEPAHSSNTNSMAFVADGISNGILSHIDSVLDKAGNNGDNTVEGTTNAVSKQEPRNVATGNSNAGDANVDTLEDAIKVLKSGSATDNQIHSIIKLMNDAIKTRNSASKVHKELGNMSTSLQKAETSLKEATDNVDKYVKMNVELSKLAHSSMANHLAHIRCLSDNKLIKENVIKDLRTMPSSVILKAIEDESPKLNVISRPTQLHNPIATASTAVSEKFGNSKLNTIGMTEEDAMISDTINFLLKPSDYNYTCAE